MQDESFDHLRCGGVESADGEVDHFQIEAVSVNGGSVRFRLVGELDAASAPKAESLLSATSSQRRPQRIELDLSGLEFCDAAGLSVFVSTHRDIVGAGGVFALLEPQPIVTRLLSICDLDFMIADAGSSLGSA